MNLNWSLEYLPFFIIRPPVLAGPGPGVSATLLCYYLWVAN